jgi:hypothetical protein
MMGDGGGRVLMYHGDHGGLSGWSRRSSGCAAWVRRGVLVPWDSYRAGDGQGGRKEELEKLHFAEEVKLKLYR